MKNINEHEKTLLIVEDEEDIRDLLIYTMEKAGYSALSAADGQSALDLIHTKKIDLILLDLMLPIIDGLTLCKILEREQVSIPIIILSAKGEDIDKILGFELGAQDYVVKPFNMRELLLRIKARLAEHTKVFQSTTGQEEEKNKVIEKNEQKDNVLRIQGIELDHNAHSLSLDGKKVEITLTEFRLLEDLMKHAGYVRTREQVLNAVWGYEFEGYGRTVDTHIRRLRMKMGTFASFIDTVRGLGYKFKKS